jgi:hypothetical protein
MFCARCGAPLHPGGRFCAACGAAVSGIAAGAPGAPGFPYSDRRIEYAGFWIRFLAIIIDGVILGMVTNLIGILPGQGVGSAFGFVFFLDLAIGAAYYTVA